MMSLPRLSGSLFGVHLRVWLLICVAMVTALTGYRYVSELNGRLEVLVESKAKLGKAMNRSLTGLKLLRAA